MLKTLRTKTKKVMLATLILVIPSFIFFYGWGSIQERQARKNLEFARFQPPSQFNSQTGTWSNWVSLSNQELLRARRQLENQFTRYFGPEFSQNIMSEVDRDNLFPLKDTIREALNQWFLKAQAENLDLQVSEQELLTIMQNDLGSFTPRERRAVLRQSGFASDAEYIDFVAQSTRMDRANDVLANAAKVSHYELWDSYRMEKQELKMDVVAFPAEDYTEDVAMDEALISTWYAEQDDRFMVNDQRIYRYAYMEKKELQNQVEAGSEKVLKDYYESHKSEKYKHGEQKKLRRIWVPLPTKPGMSPEEQEALTSETLLKVELVQNELASGTPFAEMANRFPFVNDQTGTVTLNGGLIEGWVDESRARELGWGLVQKAKELKKGEVSEPIRNWTQQGSGYAIIRVEDVRPEGVLSFEEARSQVRKDYRADNLDQLFARKADELAGEVHAYTDLDVLARDLKMKDGKTTWILTTTPVLSGDLILERSDLDYINEELREGDMSPLMRNNSKLFVLYLEKEKKAHVPEDWREIRDRVEKAYRLEMARKRAREEAEALMAKVTAEDFATTETDSLTSGSALAGLDIRTTAWFNRAEAPQDFPGAMVDLYLETYLVPEGHIGVSATGPSEEEAQAFVLWHLRGIKEPTKEEFEEELPVLERRALIVNRQKVLNGWLWDQRQKSEIKENPDYMGM